MRGLYSNANQGILVSTQIAMINAIAEGTSSSVPFGLARCAFGSHPPGCRDEETR